ncbi:hypothetical protein H4582DRAFT_2065374 [Lactarius indigo]|nr:hypothetical protein H4582DRAFT_2065374 [Lactarius indigo]
MAGWLNNYGRKVGHRFAHCGEQLAQISKLGTGAIIGRLVATGHTIAASMMSGRASRQRSGLSSGSRHSVTGRRMNVRSPRRAFALGYCPHQWTLSPILSCRGYTRATRMLRAALIEKCSSPSVSVGCAALPSVSEDDGDRPREYAVFCAVYDWLCVVWGANRMACGMPMGGAFFKGFSNSPSHCGFGAIAIIRSGEEMESENGKQKTENGNLKSVRLSGRPQVFQSGILCALPLRPCVSHAGISMPASSANSKRRGYPVGFPAWNVSVVNVSALGVYRALIGRLTDRKNVREAAQEHIQNSSFIMPLKDIRSHMRLRDQLKKEKSAAVNS